MRQFFIIPDNTTECLNRILKPLITHLLSLSDQRVCIFSDDQSLYKAEALHRAKQLLGMTINAVIIDCRDGFPIDFFLHAANAIGNTGILFLIESNKQADKQSIRFHIQEICTPTFQRYLKEGLKLYAQEYENTSQIVKYNSEQYTAHELNEEQKTVLKALTQHHHGVITLFSKRGTGKSFTIARFIALHSQQCAIVAPNQSALSEYQNLTIQFFAPDYLFLNPKIANRYEWIIVEEAAQIPIAHLEKISKLAPKILLISSVENYEGTGKGLTDKLTDTLQIEESLVLLTQQRFTKDHLALFSEYISLNSNIQYQNNNGIKIYHQNSLKDFQQNNSIIIPFYQFMNQYHYQTNAQDIRRIMDSSNQLFVTNTSNNKLIAGIWALEEGQIKGNLALEIYNGYRRPKGNLVVQTLGAHGYYKDLMRLKSLRISRIAVDQNYRKQKRATTTTEELIKYAKNLNYDFISVSFGLTEHLLEFWHKLGFTWVHMGTSKDKSTGLHACIMIYPLTDKMQSTTDKMSQKWKNDAYEFINAPFINPNIYPILKNIGIQGNFDILDKEVLNAFHEHKKSKPAIFAAKKRFNRFRQFNFQPDI